KVGAIKSLVIDAKEDFIKYFIWPALQADAIYQGQYPLATALSRPLIAKLLVDVARQEKASAVAHGCTGKGNDQVRFDVSVNAMAGRHSVGRIDHVEDRLVGIKSREIYESPAATVFIQAHKALENLVLSKDQLRFKERVAQEYAEMVYNGLWFTSMHQDLAAY